MQLVDTGVLAYTRVPGGAPRGQPTRSDLSQLCLGWGSAAFRTCKSQDLLCSSLDGASLDGLCRRPPVFTDHVCWRADAVCTQEFAAVSAQLSLTGAEILPQEGTCPLVRALLVFSGLTGCWVAP